MYIKKRKVDKEPKPPRKSTKQLTADFDKYKVQRVIRENGGEEENNKEKFDLLLQKAITPKEKKKGKR